MSMQITSPELHNGGVMPVIYTCDGMNVHPPLEFAGVPHEAKSLCLIMEDPDVPKYIREDGTWDHWLVWNIPGDIRRLEADSDIPGIVGKNTSGTFSYQGPCPPDGEHRYFFYLYALDSTLPHLSPEVSKGELREAMTGHILEDAELMVRYGKDREKSM